LTVAPPPPHASYAERTAALRSIEAPHLARRSPATTARTYEPDDTPLTTTPRVGTPESDRERERNERQEERVQSIIQSICRGC
jgi:hypothetical protein